MLANGCYKSAYAKTAHGLVRGPSRYNVTAVVDPSCAGEDAGVLLDGKHRSIGVYESVAHCLESLPARPNWCVIGGAPRGGRLSSELRSEVVSALRGGVSIANGLHEILQEDEALRDLALRHNVELLDIRKPAKAASLHFWSGKILKLSVPRIAVLGTDCGQGKRTTSQLLRASLIASGMCAELVYTGQTGWLQGGQYGFILDATPNDFVSGELEAAILKCASQRHPDIIIIEGQSALRNPAGPCGSELILSGAVSGVILQHSPGRTQFKGLEPLGCEMPDLKSEVALIEAYVAEVRAISLNCEGLSAKERSAFVQAFEMDFKIPVLDCLEDNGAELARVVAHRFRRAA